MEAMEIIDARGKRCTLRPLPSVRTIPPASRERYRLLLHVREQYTGVRPPIGVRICSAIVLAAAFGIFMERAMWNLLAPSDYTTSALVLSPLVAALGGYIGWNLVLQFPWISRELEPREIMELMDRSRFCFVCGYDCLGVHAGKLGTVDCPECGSSQQFIGSAEPVTSEDFPNTWALPQTVGRGHLLGPEH